MAFKTVIYNSGQGGMPSATLNTAGAMLAVLNLLVNGANSCAITSVTRSGSTVTVNFTGTNNFAIRDTVEVAGMNEAAYNVRFKVTARTSGSVSGTISGTPMSPGTFTSATIKHPAAGWASAALGTNIAGYRSANLQHWIQIEDNNPFNDSNATFRSRLANGLTALDTATDLGSQRKQTKPNGGWVLVADPNTCYITFSGGATFDFGEFTPSNSADLFSFFSTNGETGEGSVQASWAGNVIVICGRVFPQVNFNIGMSSGYVNPGVNFLRSYAQNTGVTFGHWLGSADIAAVSTSNIPIPMYQYIVTPSPADGAIRMQPFIVAEMGQNMMIPRGLFRGMLYPYGYLPAEMFTNNVLLLDDVVVNGTLRSVAMVRFGFASRSQLAFDLGDWS